MRSSRKKAQINNGEKCALIDGLGLKRLSLMRKS